jgi:hypothetical protein
MKGDSLHNFKLAQKFLYSVQNGIFGSADAVAELKRVWSYKDHRRQPAAKGRLRSTLI